MKNERADPVGWRALLGLEQFPAWRGWSSLFRFAGDVLSWRRQSGHRLAERPYAATSRIRDLHDLHAQILRRNGVEIPDTSGLRGLEIAPAFQATLALVAEWLDEAS